MKHILVFLLLLINLIQTKKQYYKKLDKILKNQTMRKLQVVANDENEIIEYNENENK